MVYFYFFLLDIFIFLFILHKKLIYYEVKRDVNLLNKMGLELSIKTLEQTQTEEPTEVQHTEVQHTDT